MSLGVSTSSRPVVCRGHVLFAIFYFPFSYLFIFFFFVVFPFLFFVLRSLLPSVSSTEVVRLGFEAFGVLGFGWWERSWFRGEAG